MIRVLSRDRTLGPALMALGVLLIAAGIALSRPESAASAVVDVTPSADTPVYVDHAQSDAESEGLDVPPCDDGYYLAVDGLCWPGEVVYAPDGTATINVIHSDGTVSGTVYTPDGKSFTFEPGDN